MFVLPLLLGGNAFIRAPRDLFRGPFRALGKVPGTKIAIIYLGKGDGDPRLGSDFSANSCPTRTKAQGLDIHIKKKPRFNWLLVDL